MPPRLARDSLSGRSEPWASRGLFAGPSWAPRPGPTISAGERPLGEASDRGLTPDPGSRPPSRVRGRRHGSPRAQLLLFDLWIRGPGTGRRSHCTESRRECGVRGSHTYRRDRRGPGAPPPARVAGPPPTCPSTESAGRAEASGEPHGSAPCRATRAREGPVLRGPGPQTPSGGRTWAVPIRGHGLLRKTTTMRGAPGAGGAAGRGRAV